MVWLLLQLALLDAALHELVVGLDGAAAPPLVPLRSADSRAIVYNGGAFVLLALALPAPRALLCAAGGARAAGAWRVESARSSGGALLCDLPRWWPLLFSSCESLFVYALGSQMVVAHTLVALCALAHALRAGAEHWVSCWLCLLYTSPSPRD